MAETTMTSFGTNSYDRLRDRGCGWHFLAGRNPAASVVCYGAFFMIMRQWNVGSGGDVALEGGWMGLS